ncbi:hypothetical protein GCM10009527_073150 [Actinomadura nitritigenes]|uniref:Uncharacterized protein n=1 Tax=Actinomadura nitritigenes TaxID=134602 RepID=A0ABS3RCB0_9ACTN|nr:hypothetical protein [Actinomadura nitritigenes]MBO2443869.1 hypothetical protein [Actinomadura nitritigenes]
MPVDWQRQQGVGEPGGGVSAEIYRSPPGPSSGVHLLDRVRWQPDQVEGPVELQDGGFQMVAGWEPVDAK